MLAWNEKAILGALGEFRGEHFRDHNHQDFLKSTAIQMGEALQYKWEGYCDTNGRSTDNSSLSLEPRGTKSTAIQIGGVLQYKWEVYCDTSLRSSGGWGFRASSDSGVFSDQLSEFEYHSRNTKFHSRNGIPRLEQYENPQFSEQLPERFPELMGTHMKDFHLPLPDNLLGLFLSSKICLIF